MFGSKNKITSEQVLEMKDRLESDKQYIHDVAKSAEALETSMAEIKESCGRTAEYANQVSENVISVAESAKSNIEVEAALIHSIDEYGGAVSKTKTDMDTLAGMIKVQNEEAMQLVDSNKHFTSPSKYLSEIPAALRESSQKYSGYIGKMSEYCKQMGVLALNSAIEAGRLGESGKAFVNSCEVIRTYATNYETEIGLMKEELSQANERAAYMEEQIRHLVSLLKENNIATAKLMKQCGETNELAARLNPGIDNEALTELKKNVIDLKNAEEEILKSEERNRMQLEDMFTEIETQQKNQEEIVGQVLPVLKSN